MVADYDIFCSKRFPSCTILQPGLLKISKWGEKKKKKKNSKLMILAITFKNKLKNQLKNHSSESKASGHHDIKLNLWHHLQVAKLP